jgi:hypothetical protein
MRTLAKREAIAQLSKPDFVEQNIDFHNWRKTDLPFQEKMNGVLANFAVFNCVEDIKILFAKLSLICAANCKVVATVIDTSPAKLLESYSFAVAAKSLLNMRLITQNTFRETTQQTFLHTKAKYKFASRKYFKMISYIPVAGSHFAIIIFSKR